jgi:superfamily II DNA or RNA helicase
VLRRGDTVRIRGERWRVAGETSYDRVSILDVDGCDATNANTRARFLLPFDTPQIAASRAQAPRIVSLARWHRVARATLADAMPHWDALRTAARARLNILPFQLEPALAMTHGHACRFLIADAVGLGKTIQAGLIVAETCARVPDARVLVVTPAGLREQWRDELDARFNIAADIVDAGSLAHAGMQFTPDVNPWAIHPVALTSIDYVKRPEVLRSLEALTWDVMVFDEAHVLAGRSDRATAAAALADRARVLVLLTATPHSGDDDAFTRLCELGNLDDAFPLRIFRRTRAQVGLPHGRRLKRLAVRPTAEEQAMHRALDDYVDQIGIHATEADAAAALVGSMLQRRACSSAFALARSLERRLALIDSKPADNCEQLTLPFAPCESDAAPDEELGGAWLPDRATESGWLTRLIALAVAASRVESKVTVLRRLMKRVTEPVIVFTEYRDTLHRLGESLAEFDPIELHGGLTSHERARTLRRFAEGDARLLIATDAASEGLNLHHRCRLVVNLEIPWTPIRLEQRIGRVDRLGQSRRVHAICLVAAGTSETSRSRLLDARAERVAAAFEHPVGDFPSLAGDAAAEAARLSTARVLAVRTTQSTDPARPPVAVVGRGHSKRWSLWAFRLGCVNDKGEPFFDALIGVRDADARSSTDHAINEQAVRHHGLTLEALTRSIAPWLTLATRREHAIAAALRTRHARLSAALVQPGLFDRRADRAAAAQSALLERALERSMARLSWLDRLRHLRADDRSIAFGVLFR